VHPQLAAVVSDLESASARLRQLDASLTDLAWCMRPSPGRWSAAECVAHLNLTSHALLPLFRKAIADARALRTTAPRRYRRNVLGWLASKIVAPGGGLKTRTLPAFVPTPVPPVADLINDFNRLQAEIVACVREADGLPLERVTVRSPFHGRMVYNVYAAFTLVPRHQHRHLLQAEQAALSCAPQAAAAAVKTTAAV